MAKTKTKRADNWEGDGISEKCCQQSGKDVSPHKLGYDNRPKEMEPEERRKTNRNARKDAARDPIGRIRQTVHSVFDISVRTRPSASRIEKVGHNLPDWPFVASLKDQQLCPFVGLCFRAYGSGLGIAPEKRHHCQPLGPS